MPSLRVSMLACAAALAACSTMKIRTEFDPSASYATYKTYAWNPAAPGPEQSPVVRNPQIFPVVQGMLDREMAKKGLVRTTPDANPDFLVSVIGWSKDRVEVTNYGYAYGASYAYGPYRTAVVAPVPVNEVRQYTDGTLVLDLVDAKTKKLVWRGIATDSLSSPDPDTVLKAIDAAAKELMAAYPPKTK